MTYRVLTLNNISPVGLKGFPEGRYQVGDDLSDPQVILLRSYKMHDMPIPPSLLAVGRAGAGVNNIPVQLLSERGIPVFNTPGANANAVKELVIAGLLLAARNICQGWAYTQDLQAAGEELSKQVEAGKKRFAGIELPGRTLGVIGLGAIGRAVANVALSLGMRVVGYDPGITVSGAWQLDTRVEQASSIEQLMSRAEFLTVHVPLNDSTRHLVNAKRIAMLPKGAVMLNFARDGIYDVDAVVDALDEGHLRAYVTDFPKEKLLGRERVIALPHLGASTREAEENCAIMVVRQVRDYLEHGTVVNSVNFPTLELANVTGHRMAVVNANVPNMVGQITTALADAGLNIVDMLNKSRGDLACTVVDLEQPVPQPVIDHVRGIEGVLSVRSIGA